MLDLLLHALLLGLLALDRFLQGQDLLAGGAALDHVDRGLGEVLDDALVGAVQDFADGHQDLVRQAFAGLGQGVAELAGLNAAWLARVSDTVTCRVPLKYSL